MGYIVQHVKAERMGVFSPRGAVKKLWVKNPPFERIVSGPAETGKTFGCLSYIHALLIKYAGAQIVMARKSYSDLNTSVVRTFQRVTKGDEEIVKPFGGQRPIWYDYFNGSRLWLAGLDRPGKALSSERDAIYINQAEETTLEDWETCSTRVTGRGSVMPYTFMLGDCNPGPPSHYLKQRPSIVMLESRHKDNPTLYDAQGNQLPQGAKTIAILDRLTGARYQRLRLGRWVQAEGVVFESWDESRNLIDAMPAGWKSWRKIRVVDFGYTNPFVCQWWAIDPDGRMYLYREIYYTHRLVRDHVLGVFDKDDPSKLIAPGIVHYSHGEEFEATVCDHDAEDRATMEEEGIETTSADKRIELGIKAVEERLRPADDGKPRLFVLRDCTVAIDDRLLENKKPTRTRQEFDVYVFERTKDGRSKEKPLKENDHGMDALRYAVMYEDFQRYEPGEREPQSKPEVF